MKESNEMIIEQKWWDNLEESEFQEKFRMSKRTLIDLQAEIDNCENVKKDRIEEKLLACVWLLGNTKPFDEAKNYFDIDDSETMVRYLPKIVKLASLYILWPSQSVIGVTGSLHVEVNASDRSDAEVYYNKIMEKHTIVLQVVCDNNLLLRDVCVGCPGGKTVKEILQTSPLYTLLTEKDNLFTKNNQHLLGGTEHPLLENLLTPYTFSAEQGLTQQQVKFNTLHSSIMCVVERTFRCLENRFPRLTSVDNLNADLASLIASSVCVLHNFTRVRNDSCELYM